MFEPKRGFASFSVDDLPRAKAFYADKLGLIIQDQGDMGLMVQLPGNGELFLYPKADHRPATFTVLNLIVDDLDAAVDELISRGIAFERYPGFEQDEKGIARGSTSGRGPDIAWLTDSAGNTIAVMEEPKGQ